MIRIYRRELTSKLFSLIGGVTTGLVVTMAIIVSTPVKRVPVLMTHAEPIQAPKPIQTKEPSDQPSTISRDDEQPVAALRQEQPLQIAPAPVFTLQLETPLPDQTGRNLALQMETRRFEPSRVTHQLAQAWEPVTAGTAPRYMPHVHSGNHPRRPDPGQPGIAGRNGRNPKPPADPEPASFGN